MSTDCSSFLIIYVGNVTITSTYKPTTPPKHKNLLHYH
ncbi:hypothetical protein SR187_7305 [Streptococcus ruminantium]|uniref:Uncharacterized protein n=1 Tax=Streptococcus ruminantium TaxID=1917441 RepID=A0A2Z5TSC7_9STRE|nr:hypothetical protein SR187_7305 [Streptococcus ruminantium]